VPDDLLRGSSTDPAGVFSGPPPDISMEAPLGNFDDDMDEYDRGGGLDRFVPWLLVALAIVFVVLFVLGGAALMHLHLPIGL
jgi:hypothetical protein